MGFDQGNLVDRLDLAQEIASELLADGMHGRDERSGMISRDGDEPSAGRGMPADAQSELRVRRTEISEFGN